MRWSIATAEHQDFAGHYNDKAVDSGQTWPLDALNRGTIHSAYTWNCLSENEHPDLLSSVFTQKDQPQEEGWATYTTKVQDRQWWEWRAVACHVCGSSKDTVKISPQNIVQGEWNDRSDVLEEKPCQPRIRHLAKLHFKRKEKKSSQAHKTEGVCW